MLRVAAAEAAFRLDTGHRHATVKLAQPANAATARVVVASRHIEAHDATFSYVRLAALCQDGSESWHAAISPYPPEQPRRFLHSFGGDEAVCAPERLELIVSREGERVQDLSIEGQVSVEWRIWGRGNEITHSRCGICTSAMLIAHIQFFSCLPRIGLRTNKAQSILNRHRRLT
jgi:hypothetical protein